MVEWLKLSAVTANCKVSGSSPTIRPDVVYAASFRGDVKPSIPGYWLALAFSCYIGFTSLATLHCGSCMEKNTFSL